jgi:hypothetical protein
MKEGGNYIYEILPLSPPPLPKEGEEMTKPSPPETLRYAQGDNCIETLRLRSG